MHQSHLHSNTTEPHSLHSNIASNPANAWRQHSTVSLPGQQPLPQPVEPPLPLEQPSDLNWGSEEEEDFDDLTGAMGGVKL